MPNISRRHFLRNASIGAAATGVAAAGGLNLLTGVSSADAATPSKTTASSGPLEEGSGVIAHVVDAKSGKISLFVGPGASQSIQVKARPLPEFVPTHHEVN